ncbi:PfkB family carbohydrate kinase [Streptomyces kunmingensis]|uniref:PfkB family carbohydrate kinase n=1 Tax=Streptomyces kunmingensis TaxID=68225 RepID=A0ABU6CQR3_9ACTN|nr:PfkB family carbohydrate kinase [Streptomyces kunmingensis]MEB3967017.1 PfkB family carbohydrate kinase [Streptomyces kunmingensis]
MSAPITDPVAEPITAGSRVVLAGNVIADLVIDVPALPERGGDVIGTRTALYAGGGFNALTAARRLGAPAVYAGLHGTGPYGELVRSSLAAEGVEALLPVRTDGDTGFCVALVDGGGERTFVTSFGVDARMTPDEAAGIAASVRGGDLLQVSGYGLVMEVNGPLLSGLVAGLPDDVRVCFDPGPLVADIPAAVLDPVLARVDWLSCNAREARLLSGVAGPREAAEVLRGRLRSGAGVLVRADADGCFLALPESGGGSGSGSGSESGSGSGSGSGGVVHVPGFPVEAVDSNGAGDAHVGAFLALLGRGVPAVDAARGANAAAAVAVTRRGPATSPTRGELAAFVGAGLAGVLRLV